MIGALLLISLAITATFAAETNECITGFPQPVCKNGGTCTDPNFSLLGDYKCACAAGYNGTNCEIINECVAGTNPCLNGGSCVDPLVNNVTGSILTCTCSNGYSGAHCQLINECAFNANPCLNGGACHDPVINTATGTTLTCTCAPGFSGAHCEEEDECVTSNTNPCLNGGTCTDNSKLTKNTVTCECNVAGGYSGQRCQNEDECLTRHATVCSGKTLIDANGVYYQFTAPSYAPAPLPASACYDPDVTLLNTALCSCAPDNNGPIDINGNPGISGSRCQLQDECQFSVIYGPALNTLCASPNGMCVDPDLATLQNDDSLFVATGCHCNAGYSHDSTFGAPNCNFVNECITQNVTCLHGGQCHDDDLTTASFPGPYATGILYCLCPLGFSDDTAGASIGQNVFGCILEDECLTVGKTCQNGGSCVDSDWANDGTTLACNCPNGVAADNTTDPTTTIFGSQVSLDCDYQNECALGACKNGGTCTEGTFYTTGDFSCQCNIVGGYYGKDCSYENECLTVPNACKNGGTCRDADTSVLGDYTCQCPTGFSGAHCETVGTTTAAPTTTTAAPTTTTAAPSTTAAPVVTQPALINECMSNPCVAANSLSCVDGTNKYKCICKTGFTGAQCQTNINDCAPTNPCKNGGTCVDKVNGYKCKCPAGYKGKQCQKKKN